MVVSLVSVSYATAVHHVDVKKVPKIYSRMIKPNGHHGRRLVKLVRAEDQLALATEPLRRLYLFLIDGRPTATA